MLEDGEESSLLAVRLKRVLVKVYSPRMVLLVLLFRRCSPFGSLCAIVSILEL